MSQTEVVKGEKESPEDFKMRVEVKARAGEALKLAEKWGLIQKS